ncbi:MAG: leishmanolysin [Gemmatimonadota bacterium]|nr:leishmanolysin [Gemmatimonadota bacterium]
MPSIMLHAVTTIKDLSRLWFLTSVCVACGAADSSVGPPGPPPHLTIDVRYLSVLTAQQKAVVAAAVAKWTRALSKNLGDFRFNYPANACFDGEPELNETHHNPLLFISVAEADGPNGSLALSQVCAVSARDTLPVLSHLQLDRADLSSMEALGVLPGVITHEIGHTLGFNPGSYTLRKLTGGDTNDPYFTGATARAEFAKHGAWYTGVTVPLENRAGIGPNDPHWRYFIFGDELMVPEVSVGFRSPLSSITLGFFKDLGYEVDFSVADSYEVTPIFAGNRVLSDVTLANDFRMIVAPALISPLVSH